LLAEEAVSALLEEKSVKLFHGDEEMFLKL
jgi:hypothetical protein